MQCGLHDQRNSIGITDILAEPKPETNTQFPQNISFQLNRCGVQDKFKVDKNNNIMEYINLIGNVISHFTGVNCWTQNI